MIALDHRRGQRRRQGRVPGRIDDVRRHGPRQVGVQGERQQIGVQIVRLDPRQRQMAVDPRPPMPRRVLATGWTPAASSPAANARPSRATSRGSSASARSPITACAPGNRQVQHRRRHHVEPGGGAVQADQRPGQPGRAHGFAAPPPADARASAAAAAGRRGRPPDPPSAPRRAAGRGAAPRSAARSWAGDSMLRANRITPHGGWAREQRCLARPRPPSPAMPTMAAFRSRRPSSRAPLARTRSQNAVAWAMSPKPPVRTRHSVVAVVLDLADRRPPLAPAGQACGASAAATRPSPHPRSAPPPAGPACPCLPGSGARRSDSGGSRLSGTAAGFRRGLADRQWRCGQSDGRGGDRRRGRWRRRVQRLRSRAFPAAAPACPRSLRRSRRTGCPRSRRPPACRRDCPASPGSGRCPPAPPAPPSLRWPSTVQPPTPPRAAPPKPQAISASRRVAGSMPRRWRGIR